MVNNKKLISIVVPVYNEEAVIPELLKRLTQFISFSSLYRYEVIFVEHGSRDRSFALLNQATKRHAYFKILRLARNVGADGGIVAGMQHAAGDACVILMADLQEPPELIAKLAEKWEEGYGIVYGLVKKRTAGIVRNFNSRLFYKIINLMTGNMFPENASDFRLMDRPVYEVVARMKEHNKYLRGLVMWTGYPSIGVPFDRAPRFAGTPKSDLKTVLKVASNGIFSFSYVPLRLVSTLGIFMTLVSFVLGLIYLYLFISEGRTAPGITTVILLTLILFGILFFVLGVISEYLARIYEEVKDRPPYLVKSKTNL
ncbi:MAG: glycosyltransferase family 2 protein [bacterium]